MSDIQRYDHYQQGDCDSGLTEHPDGYWVRYEDHAAALSEHTAALQAENRNLKAEVRTLRNIIETHDLCHDLHGKVGRDEFEEGCRREAVKEFGSCGWAEQLAALQARVAEVRRVLATDSKPAVKLVFIDAAVNDPRRPIAAPPADDVSEGVGGQGQ